MKHGSTSRPYPTSADEIRAALDRAPARVETSSSTYDPNDAAAVSAFWSKGVVRRPGQRGPAKKPKKVLLSIRYSPEVVQYFKSMGEGWQAQMDEALKEWMASHKPA